MTVSGDSKVIVTTNTGTPSTPHSDPTNGGFGRQDRRWSPAPEGAGLAAPESTAGTRTPADGLLPAPPNAASTGPSRTPAATPAGSTRLDLDDLGPNVADALVAIARAGDDETPVTLTTASGESLVLEPDSDAMRLVVLLADAHRERRRARTLPGLQAARALGRPGGRPSVIDAGRRAEIARLLTARGADGRRRFSYAEVAERTGVSRSTIARHAREILTTAR